MKVKVTNCREEREVLSIANILRIISKTVKSPVTSLIEEGRVILHYDIYGIGCVDDENFNIVARKIESAIDNLLSWLPNYNKTRLVTLIFATVVGMIADSVEKKELSIDYIEDIENYTLSLAKDIVSSLLTKTVNEIASKNDENHMTKIVNSIEHKSNQLVIKAQKPEKKVYIERVANHFADKESKGLIFIMSVISGSLKKYTFQ
ncbi:MAG: hypothetical protein ACMZI0_11820 [Symbiopectobacterium sp.]|uniref:hypothetical protein n=1 Tax=Symbiopectobacterium sp. TaxID=2952789 RepID=UPI0039EC4B7B